jgi:hypothetical protein
MTYCAFVVRLKNLRKHPNADRLFCADALGANVTVGPGYNETDLYLYFPEGGRLSEEYAVANDLLRRKDEDGKPAGGYLDPAKRNITAVRLRGERSEGLIMPLSSLAPFGAFGSLAEGDKVDVFGGHPICEKYIPATKHPREDRRGTAKKSPVCLFFAEHADTGQLRHNLDRFRPGDEIILTLKMHGTSGRTALLPVERKKRGLALLASKMLGMSTVVREWEPVTGSRRRVLDVGCLGEDEAFRGKQHDFFADKLEKGETVYYETVGAFAEGRTIMPSSDNAKLNDKEFLRRYGNRTVFSYGCDVQAGESDCFVYRMTMTNEDGYAVEYPWDLVKLRAAEMGAKTCPEFERFFFTDAEDLLRRVEKHNDGPDPVGLTHVREGTVARIANRRGFEAYKDKNFSFKVLEGIIKSDAEAPDREEAEEVRDPA